MADETRTVIIDVEVEDKDFDKEIGNVNTALKQNRELIKELSKDYKGNAKEIAKLEAENRDLSKSKQSLIKESKAASGSLDALRLKLAQQTKERNGLNTSTAEGSARFKELQGSIAGLNQEISGFEEAGGDFRRNVGNYPDLLGAADSATGGFISQLTGLINPMTAIVGGIGLLAASYLSTGRGTRDLARAQDRLSTAFNDVGNSIADLLTGGQGFGVINGALRAMQRIFMGIGSVIRSDIIVSIKESLREFELVQLASDKIAKVELKNAEIQRQIRDEERNSFKERREASEKLFVSIETRKKEQIATQEKLIRLTQQLLFFDEENLSLQTQLAQAQAEKADIEEEAAGFRSEQAMSAMSLAREESQASLELLRSQLEGQLILVEEGTEAAWAIRRQIIDESLAIELAAVGNNILARKTLEQQATNEITLLNQERVKSTEAASKKEGDDAETLADLKSNLLTKGLDIATNILGKGSKMGKIVALAQAGRNVAQGITKAIAQGGIAGIATGAIVAATGAIQIKKIASSKTLGGGGGSSLGGSGVSSMVASAPATGVFDASRWSPRGQQLAGDLAGTDARNNNDSQRSFADSIVQVAVVDINTAQQNRQAKVTEAQLG